MPLLPVRPLADPDCESLSVQETLRKSGFHFFCGAEGGAVDTGLVSCSPLKSTTTSKF
jgi:hypothetical protein